MLKTTIEEIDSSVKENIKYNNSLTHIIQEIRDTMKIPNLRIIGIEYEVQLKTREYIFDNIMEEMFPNLRKVCL